MKYQTRIAHGTVEVTWPDGAVRSYPVPAGISPVAYALRCAERARVSDCLAAIRIEDRPRARIPGSCGGWRDWRQTGAGRAGEAGGEVPHPH